MPSAVNAAAAVNGCEAREGSGALVGSSVMGRSSKEDYDEFGTTKNRLGAVSAGEQNAVSAVDTDGTDREVGRCEGEASDRKASAVRHPPGPCSIRSKFQVRWHPA